MFISRSLLLAVGVAQAYAATYVAQFSPTFSNLPTPTGVATSYPSSGYDTSPTLKASTLSGFPTVGKTAPTNTAEVVAAYNEINWDYVPTAPVRKLTSGGDIIFTGYSDSDPYCWWSYSNCVKPKVSYLPADLYTCPTKGDWGLSYDDGPLTPENADDEDYAEPALYNFLVNHNQKATLFYVGGNVVNFPEAAKRGFNDGNHLCVHTWSHQPMTTLTNAQVVAELFYGIKAIKAAVGVTPKCWRPPQGDVDDRVRSIAYQMGLRTVLWDEDTNDWDIGEGTTSKTVDALFQTWISNYQKGKDTTGHIVLEHELTKATVNMTMFWLPKIQQVFNVVPALACNGVSQPYWETQYVYPTTNSPSTTTKTTSTTKTTTTTKTTSTTTTKKTTTTTTKTTTTTVKPTTTTTKTTTTTTKATTTTAAATCTAGSSGKKNGDGYNGYCCTSSDDCYDTCVSGKCNGPTAPAPTTCTSGSSGKKNGDGKTGACCTSSDDCVETCRNGVCGL